MANPNEVNPKPIHTEPSNFLDLASMEHDIHVTSLRAEKLSLWACFLRKNGPIEYVALFKCPQNGVKYIKQVKGHKKMAFGVRMRQVMARSQRISSVYCRST